MCEPGHESFELPLTDEEYREKLAQFKAMALEQGDQETLDYLANFVTPIPSPALWSRRPDFNELFGDTPLPSAALRGNLSAEEINALFGDFPAPSPMNATFDQEMKNTEATSTTPAPAEEPTNAPESSTSGAEPGDHPSKGRFKPALTIKVGKDGNFVTEPIPGVYTNQPLTSDRDFFADRSNDVLSPNEIQKRLNLLYAMLPSTDTPRTAAFKEQELLKQVQNFGKREATSRGNGGSGAGGIPQIDGPISPPEKQKKNKQKDEESRGRGKTPVEDSTNGNGRFQMIGNLPFPCKPSPPTVNKSEIGTSATVSEAKTTSTTTVQARGGAATPVNTITAAQQPVTPPQRAGPSAQSALYKSPYGSPPSGGNYRIQTTTRDVNDRVVTISQLRGGQQPGGVLAIANMDGSQSGGPPPVYVHAGNRPQQGGGATPSPEMGSYPDPQQQGPVNPYPNIGRPSPQQRRVMSSPSMNGYPSPQQGRVMAAPNRNGYPGTQMFGAPQVSGNALYGAPQVSGHAWYGAGQGGPVLPPQLGYPQPTLGDPFNASGSFQQIGGATLPTAGQYQGTDSDEETRRKNTEEARAFLRNRRKQLGQPEPVPYDASASASRAEEYVAMVKELGIEPGSDQAKAMVNTMKGWVAEKVYIDPKKLKSAAKMMDELNNSPSHLRARADCLIFQQLVRDGKKAEADQHLEDMVAKLHGPDAMAIYMEHARMGTLARQQLGPDYQHAEDVMFPFIPTKGFCPVDPNDKSEEAEAARQAWHEDWKENWSKIEAQELVMRKAAFAYSQATEIHSDPRDIHIPKAPDMPVHLRGNFPDPESKGKSAKGKRKSSVDSSQGGSPVKKARAPSRKRVVSAAVTPAPAPAAPAPVGLEGSIMQLTNAVEHMSARLMIMEGEVALMKANK
ncbi:uncharacterized protein LY89DRAFT_778428 [Mollisia scopiformis]|uniref:Uncharacterized protein n=1 Tax=Mollisia scopiformis TaxID=149040 RepID=A0A194XPC8_MOLSC|nr:uncharacterized protein LY89DRAFT_778428 [Mollisia scopiformis]KUJ22105.1 hypothetical protein LY89DRAFT_778428 [Mollisia scopiformis]